MGAERGRWSSPHFIVFCEKVKVGNEKRSLGAGKGETRRGKEERRLKGSSNRRTIQKKNIKKAFGNQL